MNEPALNPSPESQSLWYYADAANEPVGPLPMDVLQRLAGVGVISPETHVLEKGGTEWKKFASIVPPPACAETEPASADIPLSSAAVPAKVIAADGIKQGRSVSVAWLPAPTSRKEKLQIAAFLAVLVIAYVFIRFVSDRPSKNSIDAESADVKNGDTRQSEPAKKAETIRPIFQHEAAYWLKDFSILAKKLDSLVDLLNSDRPMPTTVDGYAKLVTTKEVRFKANSDLKALTARIAEVEQANKAGNAYAKVAEDVRFALTELVGVVDDFESFVNQPENRVQAARNLKEHLATMKKVARDAEARYRETSSMAGFELIEKKEYKRWLDQGREHAERLAALWKQLEQNQPSKADGDRLLTALLGQGQTLFANYQKWTGTVWVREASISDPRQMDRLIQHVELEDKLEHLFALSSVGPTDFGYTWASQNEMAGNPDLVQGHKFSVETLERLAKIVEEAQREFDALTH